MLRFSLVTFPGQNLEMASLWCISKRQSRLPVTSYFSSFTICLFNLCGTNPLKYGDLLCHIDFQLNIKTYWTRLTVQIAKCGEAKLVS